ncbi:MAG: hypothetical protein NZ518_05630, partial [Dehalococcoidia bacterium]|nr:hypothetical protein [Dehalococcoidia bacterium]
WRALRGRSLLLAALLAIAPLTLYAYIPLRAPHSPYLYQTTGGGQQLILFHNDLNGFIDIVTGRVFAPKLGIESVEMGLERLAMYGRFLSAQWNAAPLLLAVIGVAAMLWRRRAAALLLLGVYLATVVFALNYRIGNIDVYFITPHWVVALFAGAAVASVAAALLRRSPAAPVAVVGGVAVAALIALPTIQNYPLVDKSHEWSVRQRWEAIMASPMEPGAILASDDRDDMMPFFYMQLVEGRRPDLVGVFPGILNSPDYSDLGRLIDTLNRPGERVYLVKEMPGLAIKYQLTPVGAVYRVDGPAAVGAPQRPVGARVGDYLRLDGVDILRDGAIPTVGVGETLEVRLWWTVLAAPPENYTTFVHLVGPTGALIAQSDARPGGDFYPSQRWRAGERLVDRHVVAVPASAAAQLATVHVGAYGTDLRRLPVGNETTAIVGMARVTRPVLAQPDAPPPDGAIWPGVGALAGVGFWPSEGRLRLFWQAERATDSPLTLFVHVVNRGGALVAQADGPPAGGLLPTTSWLPGERIVDERRVDLSRLGAGPHSVVIGWYDPVTGRRAPLADGGDALILLSIPP